MKPVLLLFPIAFAAGLMLADTKSKDTSGEAAPAQDGKQRPPVPRPAKTDSAATNPAPAGDMILRAMQDELKRSRELALADVHEPYFIEYALEDMHNFSVAANLGGLLGVSQSRIRMPLVRVRVGDYKFDNSDYLLSDAYSGTRYDADRFPLDDNYRAFRHVLWLATDRSYKTAVEAIARKQSALSNINQTDDLPDFSKAEPIQKLLPVQIDKIDTARWTERIRSLSRIFAKYPEILHSQVNLNATLSTRYLQNTEGTSLRVPDGVVNIAARASAQAKDGMVVRDAITMPAADFSKLLPDAEIEKNVSEVAEHVKALVNAPAGETYSGPVMVEGVAAAQLLAELLTPNLTLPRKPVGDPGRSVPFFGSEFEGKTGSRVLPDFLDVLDDPTQTTYNGVALFGHVLVDEEGVVPKPLTLVEKGKLQTFLLTRQPVKGYSASNGRARLPSSGTTHSAAPTNLIVRASEAVSDAELKKKLVEMVARRNKPYGIIVRKMDYPSSASLAEVRRIVQAAQAAGVTRPVSVPLLVYRVYPDGREELVRGMRFRGLNVRSLKDITAAGNHPVVFNYMYNMAPFALMDFATFVAPVSVIAPSILFEDMDLERAQEDLPKPPLVPPPPLTAAAR